MTTKASDGTLIQTLKSRFQANMQRHPDTGWADVLARFASHPASLAALRAMEETGGEPDVVGGPNPDGVYRFCDCATESPPGRRSLCYDADALASRKENKPAGSAVQMARDMGITLLDEAQYRELQQFGAFDLKTSSWLATPASIRQLGGALFGDRRYDQVFTYHNGVQSYYAARGFRGLLEV